MTFWQWLATFGAVAYLALVGVVLLRSGREVKFEEYQQ